MGASILREGTGALGDRGKGIEVSWVVWLRSGHQRKWKQNPWSRVPFHAHYGLPIEAGAGHWVLKCRRYKHPWKLHLNHTLMPASRGGRKGCLASYRDQASQRVDPGLNIRNPQCSQASSPSVFHQGRDGRRGGSPS